MHQQVDRPRHGAGGGLVPDDEESAQLLGNLCVAQRRSIALLTKEQRQGIVAFRQSAGVRGPGLEEPRG